MISIRHSLYFVLVAIIANQCSQPAMPQNPPNPYTLRSVAKLHEELHRPCTLLQQNVPLRELLRTFENAYGIQLWRDRRIDLDARVSLSARGEALGDALDRLASSIDAEVGVIESYVYLGPIKKVGRMEAAYWKLYGDWQSGRNPGKPMNWPVATSPVELLVGLAEKNRLKWESASPDVEHDLWPAGSLEAVSLAAQCSLLLGCMDCTLVASADRAMQIVTLPDTDQITIRYSREQFSESETWRKRWPDASVESSSRDGRIIHGPARAHMDLLHASSKRVKNPREKSGELFQGEEYTLEFQGTIEDLLQGLQQQKKLDFEPWPLPEAAMKKMVRIKVSKLSMDELLAKIGTEIGYLARRNGLNVTWTMEQKP